MSFSSDMSKAIANIQESNQEFVEKVAVKAFSDIVVATPVDTGQARANWNMAGTSADKTTRESTDFAGNTTAQISKAKKLSETAVKKGEDITISNSLPYINRLEHGYSQQAPQGMVRKTAQRLSAKL